MHPDVYKRPLLFILIAQILGLFFFYKPAPSTQDVYSFLPPKEVTLVGQVAYFYTAKPASNNVIVQVQSVDGQPAAGRVYARLKDFKPLWKDTLEITGKLQEPYGTELLGNFNWRNYLAYKHVFTEIKSDNVRVVQPAAWPYRVLRAVREDILRVFAESFEPQLASIAGGVLLGERGEIASELYTAFQDSGAIHLLVASGGNVGFVTLMTLAVCGLLGLSRRKALGVALLVAGIYTLIAGADAPLMRAYFMTVCACMGYYLGRNSGVWQGLVLSCVFILLLYPSSLFETGFQMSFIATAALIICLQNYPIPATWPRWVRFFAQIFVATLAVQLALLPIFTNVFYKVSLTGLVANMLLVPLASLLLGLSFAYYVFTVCHIGGILYYPTVFLLEVFKQLVVFFGTTPFSALPTAALGAGTIVAYYAVLGWVFHLPVKPLVRPWGIAALSIVLVAGSAQFLSNRRTRAYLLDEWYKNTAIVQTTTGEVFVVGGGLAPEKIKNALYKLGRRQATAVLLTDANPSKFDYTSLAPQVIRPFKTYWPQDNWALGHTHVHMQWGLHETKTGRIWYNTGYSGTAHDDVSYCFTVVRCPAFCIGAAARLVQTHKGVTRASLNQTVEVEL